MKGMTALAMMLLVPAAIQAQTMTYVNDGVDKVSEGAEVKPDGKPDFHLVVDGLDQPVKGVRIQSNDGGIWETPYNGANWIVLADQNGSKLDLYFSKFKAPTSFEVVLTLTDGSKKTIPIQVITKAVPNAVANGTTVAEFIQAAGQVVVVRQVINGDGTADTKVTVEGR